MKPRAAQVRFDPTGRSVATGATVQVAIQQLDDAASSRSGELLMQDGVSSPPVPIENEAGTDWLYEG